MNISEHNIKAYSVCEYILSFMIHRQKQLGEENSVENKLALIEEYREWITDGILKENALYLINLN